MNERAVLLEILDDAIAVDDAALGNIQLMNARLGALEIVAQRGFGAPFLNLFRTVRPDEPSACGRAFSSGRRVTIFDVDRDRPYIPYRSIAAQAGFRAVQSTPILLHGEAVGVLSTHFAQPHHLSRAGARALDRCADAAAAVAAGMLSLVGAVLGDSRPVQG